MKNTISKGTMNTPRHFTNLFTHVTRTRLNNILRLATLAAACLALPTHALAQSSCLADLNDDGEVNGADVGLVLIDYGPCPAPTPSISLVNPSSGQTTGFTAVTIFGTNFTGATSVTVGGVEATSIVVVSSTAITALSPAHSVGAVDIVVVTPNGTATLVGAFTYNAWYTILEQAPNATVVLDATVRANIVASGHPWHIRDNSSGIEMLLIPGGTFNMGEEGSATSLVHTVTLTKAFYLGKTEVTQAQWQAKMGSNPSYFSGNANNPVEQVSWDDIVGFNTVTRLRLPSEAEWEYACRGGTTTAFHSMPGYPNGTNDDSLLGNIAWYSNNNGEYGSSTYGPKPVAGKAANAFGLYDMSGNVWEWCNDLSANYPAGNATDPTGPSVGGYGDYRVRRGGHFYAGSETCRSSLRNGRDPGTRDFNIGFRVARTP